MAVFRARTILEMTRDVHAFLGIEAGLVRGSVPQAAEATPDSRRELKQVRRELEAAQGEVARLRKGLVEKDGPRTPGIQPENMIWSFGSGRTGSTWLSHMMTDVEGIFLWGEPLVGKLFADLYYGQTGRQQADVEPFILSNPHKSAWLRSVRSFVREGADARFPEAAGGYLFISEPNGSVGAPLLMEALPESRMILLVRDPRDVAASFLAAHRTGGWLQQRWDREPGLADTDPDLFVKQRANAFAQHMGKAREAHALHGGPKVTVRYEDLRADALGTMQGLFSTLELRADGAQLERAVNKHAWENVPEEQKGADKFFRKATPGGWQEDLTPRQAKIVERATAPLLGEFYPT